MPFSTHPIEFLSTTYTSQVSNEEKGQVHSHTRVVLKIGPSLETMVTMAPSEPVLSEATYFLMSTEPGFNTPRALQQILAGFVVNKGGLGQMHQRVPRPCRATWLWDPLMHLADPLVASIAAVSHSC